MEFHLQFKAKVQGIILTVAFGLRSVEMHLQWGVRMTMDGFQFLCTRGAVQILAPLGEESFGEITGAIETLCLLISTVMANIVVGDVTTIILFLRVLVYPFLLDHVTAGIAVGIVRGSTVLADIEVILTFYWAGHIAIQPYDLGLILFLHGLTIVALDVSLDTGIAHVPFLTVHCAEVVEILIQMNNTTVVAVFDLTHGERDIVEVLPVFNPVHV
jgi:hypothetical protein